MDDLKEIEQLYRDHINPDLVRLMKLSGYGVIEEEAFGSYVLDHQGKCWLDFASGYGVLNPGHCHPEIIQTLITQARRLPLSARVFFNRHAAYLARELARLAPGQLQYTFFCNSGTEAVEGALKLAHLSTRRDKFVAADAAFHGKTIGALSVSGRPIYREPFRPLLLNNVCHVPFGDLDAMQSVIDDQTAAVIIEPVQGEGGIHVAPDGYLEGIRKLCTDYGALLIVDEVQTGLGRTGRIFACEHWGIEPDIMTLAKALGGGAVPIGCFMGTPTVWEAWRGRPLLHTSTFGGNPLACAVALKTLEILERENIAGQAAVKGEYLKSRLEEIAAEYPDIIREVRGLGLLIGVELAEERFGGSVLTEMRKLNVIALYTMNQPRVIRFEPPLTVSIDEIDQALAAFRAAVDRTRERFFPKQSDPAPTSDLG